MPVKGQSLQCILRAHIIVALVVHSGSLLISHTEDRMKKALSAPVQLWQLVLASFLVAALATSAAVLAGPAADGFLPHGQVRFAVAGDSINSVTVPAGYTNTAVLEKTITVPKGRLADLMAVGEVNIQSGALTGYQYCFGEYRLDDATSGTQFQPGNYILEGFNPPQNNLSLPINGYLTDVEPGDHTIYMVVSAGYADCIAQTRSMIISVNLH